MYKHPFYKMKWQKNDCSKFGTVVFYLLLIVNKSMRYKHHYFTTTSFCVISTPLITKWKK